jgi:hypothetical protein
MELRDEVVDVDVLGDAISREDDGAVVRVPGPVAIETERGRRLRCWC